MLYRTTLRRHLRIWSSVTAKRRSAQRCRRTTHSNGNYLSFNVLITARLIFALLIVEKHKIPPFIHAECFTILGTITSSFFHAFDILIPHHLSFSHHESCPSSLCSFTPVALFYPAVVFVVLIYT